MRKILLSFAGLLLLISNQVAGASGTANNPQVLTANQAGTGAVIVASTPELTPLAMSWIKVFNATNPEVKVSLATNQTNSKDQLTITNQEGVAGTEAKTWSMVVGKDVFVPVIHANNPMLTQLTQTGITIEKLQLLLSSKEMLSWSDLVANGSAKGVKLYVANQSSLVAALSLFAKTNQIKATLTAEEIISAVKMDPFAIGFCKLNDLKQNQTNGLELIKYLPIDKNGNGRLDNFENIYGNSQEFTHGVWIGKYPSALTSDIFATSLTQPTDKNTLAFLNWILNNGQQTLNANGYCDLTTTEKQAGLASLLIKSVDNSQPTGKSAPTTWPIVLTVFGMIGLFTAIYFISKKGVASVATEPEIQIAPMMIENAIDVPKGLYFDKSHTWAFMETDGKVKVGMDDFLQHITGKLTRIKMKEVGESVRKGEKIVTIIREGKQLNLYAPISGTIVKQNKLLNSDSTLLNSSPYTQGWVYQIEPKNWLREIQFMLMGEKYADWLRDEFVRLRDFIAASVKTNELAYAHVILQDGGELSDNVLADMDPKVWEDFQTKFIDASK